MKRKLEITFMDGTKALYAAKAWDDLRTIEEGLVQIESKGQAFAWYPIRNIKSIIAVKEGDGK